MAAKGLPDDPRPLDWNGPVDRPFAPFSPAAFERSILDHLEQTVRRHRDRVAIRDGATTLTFGELWDAVSGLAERLAADGRPGELIGILLPTGSRFVVAMLACLAAGRPFVALDTAYPADWLKKVLEDAKPGVLVTHGGDLPHLVNSASAMRVVLLISWPEPAHGGTVAPESAGGESAARAGWRPARFGLDEPACVLFTSGSTGRPKGIVNSQRNLLQRVAQSIDAAHINADDRLLTLASPCAIAGVRDVMTALLAGASVHLIDPLSAGVREILNTIRDEAITILFAFPALLRSIVAAAVDHSSAGRAGPALRLMRVGGDTTLWSDIDSWRSWLAPGAHIQLIYAATEAPMMQWFVNDACRGEDARIPIGYPLPGNWLALADDEDCATAAGAFGEIVVGSAYVALGRWVDGRCSAEDDARPGAPATRVFRSGDVARLRSDGLLERVGRTDRQVKISGTRVDIDGVEAALRGNSHVRDVAVVARTSSVDGSASLIAYVNTALSIEEMRAFAQSMPRPMRPARFYRVEKVPRLPNSKLDVRGLAALDKANVQRERASTAASGAGPHLFHLSDRVSQAVAHVWRTVLLSPFCERSAAGGEIALGTDNGVARTVARVWQSVLLAPVRSPADDFFAAGGDSLTAIRLVVELERALGVKLSPTLIYDVPRFDPLCEALRQRRVQRYDVLVPLKPGTALREDTAQPLEAATNASASAPPLFFIHGLGGNILDILPTARRMTYAGAVIGIRARGLVRGEKPHSSIEAMATDYLREIKLHQPAGPYSLCGYSFGGLVAFEIARRLTESGERVAFVGLFDTMMSSLRSSPRTWLARISRSIASTPLRMLRVAVHSLIASARYRAGSYAGHLTLFTPAGRDPSLPPLESIWRQHARTLSVIETGGQHATMLSTSHADSTAAALTRCLAGGVSAYSVPRTSRSRLRRTPLPVTNPLARR